MDTAGHDFSFLCFSLKKRDESGNVDVGVWYYI